MKPAAVLGALRRPGVVRRARPGGTAQAAALLRGNPVLLLAERPADGVVDRLLRDWNPQAALPEVADGVRWAGPFTLGQPGHHGNRHNPDARDAGVSCVQAGLPGGWAVAYAALSERDRVRVPDGLDADRLRLRYPAGMPSGTEAIAWSLVTGLARRLDGATRLPGRAPGMQRGADPAAVHRARAQENTYCVYGHEPLSWSMLRTLLAQSLPDLDRNGTLAPNDYCLDRPGSFEVRVRPLLRGEFLPYALRPRATEGWPLTLYRFRCLPQTTDLDARRIDVLLRGAACLLADIVGGVLLDGDGFPLGAGGLAVSGR